MTLALAMLMPAMLLTTACSNDDEIVNTENDIKKGYELPVTINVTREGDDPATRATYTYNNTTHKGTLAFSTGDKLFVWGRYNAYADSFYGTLTWQSGGTFSGTITASSDYSGTAQELFAAANWTYATLLPDGYDTYQFLKIVDKGSITLDLDFDKAFTTVSKAEAVEQFSYERSYSYSGGFALAPQNAILNFTISGLTANASNVAVSFTSGGFDISGTVDVDGDGNATFAVGVMGYTDLNNCSLTVDGNAITLVNSSKTLTAGHIYNITRSAAPAPSYDETASINAGDVTVPAGQHWLITGTGSSTGNKITIGAGATVTLDGVDIHMYNYDSSPCIECLGSATIILKDGSTNSLVSDHDKNPALWIGDEGTTLTIQGSTGTLTVMSGNYCAGIGGGYSNTDHTCGNIVIEGGVINATGGNHGAGIGSDSEGNCGSITINGGTVTAEGKGSAAGIGGGNHGDCGDITITDGADFVEATKGPSAPFFFGPYSNTSQCTVTIDGVVNPNTGSTFTHFNSDVNDSTWTLTHK